MHNRCENFDIRLTALRKHLQLYADELRKLTTESEVTHQQTDYFSHLFSDAIQMGMTDDEIRDEFNVLNTPMTMVVDTNPNRGYRSWTAVDPKKAWITVDRLCLSLMSPLQYQHWVYDVGETVGIKSARSKAPPPRPIQKSSAATDMLVTTSVCEQTGVRTTIYTPR